MLIKVSVSIINYSLGCYNKRRRAGRSFLSINIWKISKYEGYVIASKKSKKSSVINERSWVSSILIISSIIPNFIIFLINSKSELNVKLIESNI